MANTQLTDLRIERELKKQCQKFNQAMIKLGIKCKAEPGKHPQSERLTAIHMAMPCTTGEMTFSRVISPSRVSWSPVQLEDLVSATLSFMFQNVLMEAYAQASKEDNNDT